VPAKPFTVQQLAPQADHEFWAVGIGGFRVYGRELQSGVELPQTLRFFQQ
jgi:hypothetical protein